jgi:hypothetical protein
MSKHKSQESFDARISNYTDEECGRMCTKVYGCKGYAFDKNTNKCYLSKDFILGQPSFNTLYSDEYLTSQLRCNKKKPIDVDLEVIREADEYIKKDNTVYLCSDNERDVYTYYKIVNGTKIAITPDQVRTIPYEPYVIGTIDWPKKKKDIDPNIPSVAKEQENLSDYNIFQKDNREYLGQYLFPYQCVNNISENECLDTCDKNSDCEGVEYNPEYIKDNKLYRNVCCPKRILSEIITRRPEFEHGSFYVKKKIQDLDKKKYYIDIN